MRRIVCLFVFALLVSSAPSWGDIQPIGPPIPGDWGQAWQDNESPYSYNEIIIQWVSGSPFDGPALSGLSNGWQVIFDNATLAAASGPDNTDESFTTNFFAQNMGPEVFNYWALEDGVVVPEDSGELGYGVAAPQGSSDQGYGWWWSPIQAAPPSLASVPEPTALLLLSMMGALVLGVPKLLSHKVR